MLLFLLFFILFVCPLPIYISWKMMKDVVHDSIDIIALSFGFIFLFAVPYFCIWNAYLEPPKGTDVHEVSFHNDSVIMKLYDKESDGDYEYVKYDINKEGNWTVKFDYYQDNYWDERVHAVTNPPNSFTKELKEVYSPDKRNIDYISVTINNLSETISFEGE